MKKLLFIILMAVVGVSANAQITEQAMAVTAADDTLVNADTGYVTSGNITAEYSHVFSITIVKASGTISGGSVILQGWDGEGWITLASSTGTIITGQYTEDTATLTNTATQTFKYKVAKADATFSKYRARVISAGTQTCAITGIWYRLYLKP